MSADDVPRTRTSPSDEEAEEIKGEPEKLTPIPSSLKGDVRPVSVYRHGPARSKPIKEKITDNEKNAYPGVWGYHPLQNFQPTVFTMPENHKYKELLFRKQKREKKLEKNVVSTTAAEDIGGFHGNLDIDSIIDVS